MPTVVTFDPHPRIALGYGVELLVDARAAARAARGARGRGHARRRVRLRPAAAASPRTSRATCSARSAPRSSSAGETFRFGHRRRGDLALLRGLGFDARAVPFLEGVSSTEIRRLLHEGDVAAAAGMLGPAARGRGHGRRRRRARRHARLPDREPRRRRRTCSCPRTASTPARRSGHRAAISIGTNPHYGGPGAEDRGVPARLRRRPLRAAPRRRALAAPARRAGLRERAGADRPDRPRRRGDPRRDTSDA